MSFKVKGYKRLENRDTIEVQVQNPTLDLGGLVHVSGRGDGVYFNGKICCVPRLCQIMDDTECDGMTLEVVDGKSLYFTLDESGAHSWTVGNPGSVRHSVERNAYAEDEFSLTVDHLIDSKSRGNGTYFGDKTTRIYLNGANTSAFPGMFLEGNRIKKISWHWHYCATMDKYVKWLSEVWFVNTESLKERSGGQLLVKSVAFDADAGVRCRVTRVDKDYRWMCYFVYLTAVDNTGKEHCYQFKIPDNGPFNIIGGKRSDLDCWITFSKWHVKGITYVPNPNGYDILMSMSVVDMADVYTVPNPKYDINVLKARLDIKPVEFIPYDPSEFEFKPSNNKEETKMATTYDAKTGRAFGVKKVIFNPPATIVFWKDGSKTVVKCSENDVFDPLAGIAFALMRKVYGKEYRRIEKYAKEYDKLHPPVDISAMALDSLLDDLADAAMAGYVMSDKETHALVKDETPDGSHE